MLYEEAVNRYNELSELYAKISNQIAGYPEGKIHIVRSMNRVQYYLRSDAKDKSGAYISKREKEKIALYVQKKYYEDLQKLIANELGTLSSFLKKSHIEVKSQVQLSRQGRQPIKLGRQPMMGMQAQSNQISIQKAIQRLYSDYPEEVKRYIIPVDISDEEYSKEWLSIPFARKGINKDLPTYMTNNGEYVRSKSELTIANALAKHGVPYKYECPLMLANGSIIYPDFTVLNVKKRKEMFWEHRGMMDDRDYAKHAVKRFKQMELVGIVLGDNLIITEETTNCPLGTDEIELTIEHYLLAG